MTTSQPRPTGKLRLLALHSFRTSAKIFREQVGSLDIISIIAPAYHLRGDWALIPARHALCHAEPFVALRDAFLPALALFIDPL